MLNDSSQFDKLIDYKKLIMFKPYLKRTKLTQIQLYTKTQSHPHSDHDKLQKSKYSLATSTFGIQQSIIFPTSFYEKQSSLGDNPLTTVFNPLNSQWIEFPQTIKRLIENSQFEREQLRNFGCYREVIWYYHENILYIWNHNDKIVNRYEMHKQTGCIQVGELQSSSLHFKTRNLYIIAAGVTNRLYLFGIDKKTLSISDLKFNYQIINSRLIQKIKFIKQNEIIIGSDTALLCHFDFSVDLKVSYNKLSIMQIALPYLPLLYPDSRSYIQNLVMTDDFIHLLIKQQKPINWFKLKTKETLNKLMMKDGEIPKYVQRRVIEVHQLDRSKTQINKICRVTQEQFIKKLKLKFPQFLEYKEQQDLKIVSIYEDKYKFGSLGVVTRCGYFINLTVSDSSIIVNELLKAPKENSVGIAGLYLQKKGNEEVQNRENVVRSSLGANNLSVINNCIWYFSPNSLECVKCEKIEGSQIFQIKNDDSQKSIWLVFSKLGYCKIKRLETSQVLIAYLCARSKLKEEEEKSWTYEANFQIFIENLAKLIGYQQICQSLISFLISDRKIVKIAQPIMELAETQLKGTPNRDLRDWDYSIGNQTPTIQIAISQFLKDQLWKCFIQMQSKAPNKQDQTLVSNQIHCSSYWYALRKNFVKQSSPLLKLQAKTMKLRLQKTQQRIKRLQKLQQFFSLKKENEFKYLTMKLNNKKDTIRRDKYSSNRYPSGKLKPVLLPIQPKKEEQITQSSVQPGSIISSLKFVNESSTKLQELISWSIKKLKSFVVVYIYLADLNENQKLGSLQEVLKNRKERNAMKKYLLERVQDQQKLIQFSKTLPQLQLQKALQFNKWYKHQQKNSYKPQNLNLVQISKIITSQNFKEIKEIFRQKYDLQADLFLLYWDYLYSQMDFLNKKQIICKITLNLESKKTEIFTKEVAAFKKEKTQSIYEQMNAIKLQIQQIITSSIKLYIDSRGDEYRKAETILNNIIKIITSHNDETIITYAQSEMSNAGLIQKQILLQRSKKKKEIIPTATEILTSTYELKPQPKVRRECLSNYQVYLLQDDK